MYQKLNEIKEIVFVGSGSQYLDIDIVNKYFSDDYVTIGPRYDTSRNLKFDYYFWTGNAFKVWVAMPGLKLPSPKIKSFIVSCAKNSRKKLLKHYSNEMERLKYEFVDCSPWKHKGGGTAGPSTGSRTLYFLMAECPKLESIIFLGCSYLAGDGDSLGGHDFRVERNNILDELKQRNIKPIFIHKNRVGY